MLKLILSSLLLSVLACSGGLRQAGGKDDDVFVVADPTTWADVEEPLRESLERQVLIVHDEQVFHLIATDPDHFERYTGRKNLVFVGRTGGQRTSRWIQELLPPASLKATVEKGAGMFVIDDPYREGQTAIVIAGTSDEAIRRILASSSDILFRTLFDRAKERIKRRVLSGLRTRLADRMREKYGWALNLPLPYKLIREEINMVRFARHYPDRLISVYWEDDYAAGFYDCLGKREWFGRAFHDGDVILKERTEVRDEEVDGMQARRIDGIWQNEKQVMGGPFITLCLHVPGSNRRYLVDGLLFAPGKKKWVYLTEIEGIVETFRPE
jgi:hypothetical protein